MAATFEWEFLALAYDVRFLGKRGDRCRSLKRPLVGPILSASIQSPGSAGDGRRRFLKPDPQHRLWRKQNSSLIMVDSPERVGTSLLQCSTGKSAIWEMIPITQEADAQTVEGKAGPRPLVEVRGRTKGGRNRPKLPLIRSVNKPVTVFPFWAPCAPWSGVRVNVLEPDQSTFAKPWRRAMP